MSDFKTVKEIEREMCSSYDLEYYDRDSIKEIEHLVNLNTYTNTDSVREHMDFLEKLLYKLQYIRMEEIKEGFPTLELDESITEVGNLFRKLTNVLYSLKRNDE